MVDRRLGVGIVLDVYDVTMNHVVLFSLLTFSLQICSQAESDTKNTKKNGTILKILVSFSELRKPLSATSQIHFCAHQKSKLREEKETFSKGVQTVWCKKFLCIAALALPLESHT